MVFSIPDDLAPEVYPLAWLVGDWRGYCQISYPDIDPGWFLQEISVAHDGGPYLKMESNIWQTNFTGEIPQGMPGLQGAEKIEPASLWSTEVTFWRPVPGQVSDEPISGKAGDMPPTALEVLSTDPAGHLVLFAGVVQGPRIQLQSDQIIRTASAVEINEVRRMYGLIKTELLWVQEMSAFGKELAPYASGQLGRV